MPPEVDQADSASVDDAILVIVRQWTAKAEIDFRTAERLLNDEDPIRESIASSTNRISFFGICEETHYKGVSSVYRPIRRFTKSTVELAIGVTRSAPSRKTPAKYPGSAAIWR